MSTLEPWSKSWSCLKVAFSDHVVEVTLSRPEARNALNAVLMRELTEIARDLRLRSDIRAVVLTGHETFFSAGADLDGVKDRLATPSLLEMREALMAGPDMCKAWSEIEVVTIAAIEGYCVGGACALALACDFRIMADGAFLRLPEVPLGINMSWRSIPRIASLIGPARAKRFVMFGEPTDATTCVAWGFAEDVAPKGQALTQARAWAAKVAGLPPLPIRMTKEAVEAGVGALHHATSFMDRDQYMVAMRSQDFREGVSAFFEKRKPDFKGD